MLTHVTHLVLKRSTRPVGGHAHQAKETVITSLSNMCHTKRRYTIGDKIDAVVVVLVLFVAHAIEHAGGLVSILLWH